MDNWSLLDESRWRIIESLAKGSVSMAQIAKDNHTTVANVSQHLKILEAYGLVKKEAEKSNGKPGKPITLYSLKRNISMLAVIDEDIAERKTVDSKNRISDVLARILLLDKGDDQYYLTKFFMEKEEVLDNCDAVCFLRSSSEKIELLLVTSRLDEVRKAFSSNVIKSADGNEKIVACWSHDIDEIKLGVGEGDKYYIDMMSKYHVLYNPNKIMQRWKK